MNHALKAVIALVMGAGLAAGAQAHGTYMHHARSMSQQPPQMSQRLAQPRMPRQQIRMAQQQLKADGLYKGKVDGKFNRATKLALQRFEQRNGLPRTATLNRRTFDRLTGNKAVGVGSSQPKSSKKNLNPNANAIGANANGNGSGSSTNNNATAPMTPPATNPSNTGAGNNNGTTDQNNTTGNK
jgi:putative peptidoglycan binding protein